MYNPTREELIAEGWKPILNFGSEPRYKWRCYDRPISEGKTLSLQIRPWPYDPDPESPENFAIQVWLKGPEDEEMTLALHFRCSRITKDDFTRALWQSGLVDGLIPQAPSSVVVSRDFMFPG